MVKIDHELTNCQFWLESIWLTEKRSYAPTPQIAQPDMLAWLLTVNGCVIVRIQMIWHVIGCFYLLCCLGGPILKGFKDSSNIWLILLNLKTFSLCVSVMCDFLYCTGCESCPSGYLNFYWWSCNYKSNVPSLYSICGLLNQQSIQGVFLGVYKTLHVLGVQSKNWKKNVCVCVSSCIYAAGTV